MLLDSLELEKQAKDPERISGQNKIGKPKFVQSQVWLREASPA